MRLARKLFLLTAMVVAAMAMAAGSASAQIAVADESTGNPCSAVSVVDHTVSGGCLIHATSTGTNIALFVDHSLASICSNEYTARVDSSGHGYIYGQAFAGDNCFVTPCTEADGHREPWEIQLSEAGGTKLEASFCVEDIFFDVETRCHLVGIDVTLDGHDASFHAEDAQCTNIESEVTGDWTTEAASVEITHQ